MHILRINELTDTLWGYRVLHVMMQHKALHLLTALTFVFVNLVCPCASASMMSADEGEHGQHQHHEMPAESDCPHSQCPDCNSALAVSCDTGALVPSTLVKTDLDNDTPIIAASVNEPFHKPYLHSTGPPGYVSWHPPSSPISRYDSQLE